MQEVKEKRHITEEMWIALEQDTISQEEFMQILEHTGDCTWCADKMAAIMDDTAEIMPPSYLTEQILERTKQVDIQTAVTIKHTSKRLQLLLYSLRVGAAVVFSIFILSATANFQDVNFMQMHTEQQMEELQQDTEERKEKEQKNILNKANQAADGVAERMSEFANLLLNGGKRDD